MQILNYSDNRCTKFERQWSKITVFYLACQVLISWLQASKRELGSVWFQTWTVGMLFSQEDHHDMAFLFPQFLKIHLNSIKLKIFNKAISPSLPPPQKKANSSWSGLPKACTHRVVSFKKFLLCSYCQGLYRCVFSLSFPESSYWQP